MILEAMVVLKCPRLLSQFGKFRGFELNKVLQIKLIPQIFSLQNEGLNPISTGVFLSEHVISYSLVRLVLVDAIFTGRISAMRNLLGIWGANQVSTSVFCFWKIGSKKKREDIIDGNQLNTEGQSRELKARETTTHSDGCFLIYSLPFCTLWSLEDWPLWIPSVVFFDLWLPVELADGKLAGDQRSGIVSPRSFPSGCGVAPSFC